MISYPVFSFVHDSAGPVFLICCSIRKFLSKGLRKRHGRIKTYLVKINFIYSHYYCFDLIEIFCFCVLLLLLIDFRSIFTREGEKKKILTSKLFYQAYDVCFQFAGCSFMLDACFSLLFEEFSVTL